MYYFESERVKVEPLVDCNGLEMKAKMEMGVQWRGGRMAIFLGYTLSCKPKLVTGNTNPLEKL